MVKCVLHNLPTVAGENFEDFFVLPLLKLTAANVTEARLENFSLKLGEAPLDLCGGGGGYQLVCGRPTGFLVGIPPQKLEVGGFC